jgi:glycosyltransferase involved in cell wall biosynthesis
MVQPIPVGLVAPLPPQVGGVASVAEWLLDHSEDIGCSYTAFDLERPLFGNEGRNIVLAVPRQLRQFLSFAKWSRRCPRVVHYCISTSWTGLPRDVLYVAMLRLRRRKTIAHVHGSSAALAASSAPRSVLLRLISRWTSERVALSPTHARIFAGIGVPSRAILNPLRFEPPELRKDHPVRSFRLLFIGAYGRRKGCLELIEAVSRARQGGHDIHLTIVGKSDPYKGDGLLVENAVRASGLDDIVDFVGVKAAEEMPALYGSADALCLPSWHEGLPMVILEAMAFARPVVATTAGGIPDLVVDGESGFLIEPGDVDGLSDALTTLAREPELRERMGTQARERVLELASRDVIASEWGALYESIARDGAEEQTRPHGDGPPSHR